MAKSDTRYEKSDIRYENSDIRCPLTSSRSDILCIGYIWYSLPPDTDEVSGIWKSLRIRICSGPSLSLSQSHKAAWPGITEVSFSLQNSDLPNLTNKIRNAVTSCKCLASIICLNFAQPDGEAMAIKQVK